jgi:LacI family transcriptional regulator
VFDGELPDTAVLTTISQDSYESGMLAGKLLHWMAGSSRGPALDFLSVTVGRDDFHLRARRRGFEDYAADKPGVALQHLEIDGADVSPAVVEALAGSAAQSRRPAGIFVTNSAAHQVVEALPRGNRPAVVGYDLIPANVAALREGGIDVLFNQQPQQQGRRAVYALYRYLVLGEAPGPRERISIDLVVPETLDRSALHGAETDRATGKTPDKTSDNSPDNTPENTPNKPQDKRKESRS